MRPQSGGVFPQDQAPARTRSALRFLARQLAWAGETFIGLSFLVLCKAGGADRGGHPETLRPGLLLPADGGGAGGAIPKEITLRHRCPGCFREVLVLLLVEGVMRCDDCRFVIEDKINQWVNARNN